MGNFLAPPRAGRFYLKNNSLNGQGLGGAHALAVAKASDALAPPVYMESNNLFLPLVREFFGRGAGEPFF